MLDSNVFTVSEQALSLKAPIANPTFTGNPKAPTPANADDSTKLATTEFVYNILQQIVGLAGDAVSKGVFNLDTVSQGTVVNVTGIGSDAATNNWPVMVGAAGDAQWWNVITFGSASNLTQLAIGLGGIWMRVKIGGSWVAWYRLATASELATLATKAEIANMVTLAGTQSLTNKSITIAGDVAWAGGSRFQVQATNDAFISFHRSGAFAANFGIDTSNTLKWAGWSLGGNVPWSVTTGGVMNVLAAVTFNQTLYTITGNTASTTLNFGLCQKLFLNLVTSTTVTMVFPGVGNYLLLINNAGHTVTWSGANNPQWVGAASAPAINPSGYTIVSVFCSGATQAWIQISKVNTA